MLARLYTQRKSEPNSFSVGFWRGPCRGVHDIPRAIPLLVGWRGDTSPIPYRLMPSASCSWRLPSRRPLLKRSLFLFHEMTAALVYYELCMTSKLSFGWLFKASLAGGGGIMCRPHYRPHSLFKGIFFPCVIGTNV